jgi:glycosyltransferase involved in cell wall biosynthesis
VRIAVAFDCLFPWTKGGGERQYRTFAEEFAAVGHEVTYLTRQQWDGDAPSVPGMTVEVISHDRELYDENGVRRLGPALRFGRGLFTHLVRNRRAYDAILISATPATNVFAARAALAGTGTVIAVDWLEVWRAGQWRDYSGPLVGRVANALQWLGIRLSPIATCHSRFTAYRLRERGVRAEPVVSPGLIDAEDAGEPVLTRPEPPRVIFIGRHIPDKRVESLPAAVAYAREQIPDLTATIYGDGPTTAAVRAEVDRLGLGDIVRLPGFVDQDELAAGIQGAACLVNPSGREGYGLVVVESAAAGTPVVLVAAEDNASVELIEDGVNGRVAASTAADSLGAAIVDVVTAGEPMRKSTYAWFAEANKTRTIRAAARQLADRLVEAAGQRSVTDLR